MHAPTCRVPSGARAERVNHARHLIADHARRLRRIRVQPLRGHHVGEAQPGGAHTDPHLARGRLGIGRFPHLQRRRPSDGFPVADERVPGSRHRSTWPGSSRPTVARATDVSHPLTASRHSRPDRANAMNTGEGRGNASAHVQ